MNCKYVQDMLKADHFDGEASQAVQQDIATHLAQCPSCRMLESELQAQRILFKSDKPLSPPESVWRNIRSAIVSERMQQEAQERPGILQRLLGRMLMPRPVFAFASAFMVLVCVTVLVGQVMQKRQPVGTYKTNEIVMAYSASGVSEDFLCDLGTGVEEYFL